MKKLKNNKGITGIDIVVSISLIVMILGIVMAVYTDYAKKTKEVKRRTTATNLAMKVIEYIESTDDTNLTGISTTESQIDSDDYGVGEIPKGYTIKVKKIISDTLLENIAFQVDITVSYNVEEETKKITFSTIKKYEEIGEAQAPDMTSNTIKECIPVKYDVAKGGYVQTDENDSEWYSISSKEFPIVVKLRDGVDFNRNGVVKLKDCDAIYAWVPSYRNDGTNYRFLTKENDNYYDIKFVVGTTTEDGESMYYYKKGENKVDKSGGEVWQKINESEKPIDDSGNEITNENNQYNIVKNKIFIWQ